MIDDKTTLCDECKHQKQTHRRDGNQCVSCNCTDFINKREKMLAIREKLLAENPQITRAQELSPLMHEAGYGQEYWEWQLDRYIKESMGSIPS